jgi:DNA-binding transcriptional LysR family regulator
MDPRQLAVLRELGDRGSVTAVAAALFVTPSAVSQQLAALQRRAAVPLTERRGRTLVLTGAGRALAAAAADVATALARADRAVDDYLTDPRASVRIAAFHSAAATFFPRLLQAAGSGPVPECADQDVEQARFPALTADYDIVIAHRPDHSPPWPAETKVTPLLHEPLDVALPIGHPLAARTDLSAADVSDQPWIAVQTGYPLLGSLEAIAAAADRPLQIRHRINDFTVAAALVAAGGGIALMPRYTAPARPDVVLRSLRDLHVARRVDALMRPERALRTSVTATLGVLDDIARRLTEVAETKVTDRR